MQGTHRSISKYTDVGGRSVTFSVSAVYKDDSIHEGRGVRVRQADTAGMLKRVKKGVEKGRVCVKKYIYESSLRLLHFTGAGLQELSDSGIECPT